MSLISVPVHDSFSSNIFIGGHVNTMVVYVEEYFFNTLKKREQKSLRELIEKMNYTLELRDSNGCREIHGAIDRMLMEKEREEQRRKDYNELEELREFKRSVENVKRMFETEGDK